MKYNEYLIIYEENGIEINEVIIALTAQEALISFQEKHPNKIVLKMNKVD